MRRNDLNMQRVRIGLTGLGFVFLVVLLAAILTGQSADEAPITANLIELEKAGASLPTQAAPQPTDPLAELGVAPGHAAANAAASQAAPPASAATPVPSVVAPVR
jgi:uncharacterized membrane protein YfcA